jgi:hypothetical protein
VDHHIAAAVERQLSLDDVGLAATDSPEVVRKFCDSFCRRLVVRYLLNELSWEEADVAANNTYLLMIKDCGGRVPGYAWDVYLAFDEGEIGDRGDSFTRPRILEINKEYGYA